MKGAEHWREAERLTDTQPQQAQVHALLACAAAFLAVAVVNPDERAEWDRAMGRPGVTA